jgi:hypothetical protein
MKKEKDIEAFQRQALECEQKVDKWVGGLNEEKRSLVRSLQEKQVWLSSSMTSLTKLFDLDSKEFGGKKFDVQVIKNFLAKYPVFKNMNDAKNTIIEIERNIKCHQKTVNSLEKNKIESYEKTTSIEKFLKSLE